jgi:tripartite-type tricarboxylate transporter receptor subunit TctC
MTLRSRRQVLHLAAGAAALPAMSRVARAQSYPSRPVRLIVGAAPAGVADILARLIGQRLSEQLGQPFVIENRPGAGGNIGTEAVVNAPPDGYTLLLVTANDAISPALFSNLKFNFIHDIAPIASVARYRNVMLVNPSVPAKTVPEFIAYAKANPAKVNMASAGNGSASHMAGELFKMMAGVNMVHVPYRGGGPALADLLGGQVQVNFGSLSASIEYTRAGRLRALAVTTATRSEALPDIPVIADFVPGFDFSPWVGIGAPKNTPVHPRQGFVRIDPGPRQRAIYQPLQPLSDGTFRPVQTSQKYARRLTNPVGDHRALLQLEIERSANELLWDLQQLLGKRYQLSASTC